MGNKNTLNFMSLFIKLMQGMLVSSFFFALFCFSNSNGDRLPQVPAYDTSVYHTLFGNIGSMDDLFLIQPEDAKPGAPTSEANATDEPDDDFDGLDLEFPDTFKFNRVNLSTQAFDIQDFKVINEKYSNVTKEYRERLKKQPKNKTRRYIDSDDSWHYESIEDIKRNQLMMVMVQFALHCRYEVGKVLLQRDLIRDDKRYKLGYLFNRMRRLKTEQLKMVGSGYDLLKSRYRHMYSMMRLYERVVHFDVDMRDTAAMIRRVYAKYEQYDKIELRKKD